MTADDQQSFSGSSFAVTVDGNISAVEREWQPAGGKVALVEGSGIPFSYETQCLLQRRLKAAAIILLFGFGLFLFRRLFVDTPLWQYHLGLVLVLSFLVAGLSRPCEHSLRQLRIMELMMFGLCVMFLAAHQAAHMLQESQRGDATTTLAAMKSSVLYFFSVMVIYGTFIPNTWRRTASIVVPIAVIPAAVAILLRMLHPEFNSVIQQVATFAQVSDHVLMLLIGAVVSTYGTHIINTLRVEAFEAKQFGQYHLGRSIGKGGMGEVFLAEHQLLKRPCAIKVIRPDRAIDANALARFEREVRTAARLSHPNTIDIYDFGRTDEGVFFYVMEFLPGMDLAELIERHGPLPPERVIHLLRQVCHALSEAHSIGFVHRDVKPGNIFVAHRGGSYDVAKVLDFGLVRSPAHLEETQLTQDGALAGSPLYMSPEQASGQSEPDARSDIYSLGAVAYHILTGRPPFEETTPMKVIIAHARDQVLPPSKHRPGIPRRLEQIVVRCLAKVPGERFQDVESLDQALAACETDQPWTQTRAAEWWQQAEPQRASDDSSAMSQQMESNRRRVGQESGRD